MAIYFNRFSKSLLILLLLVKPLFLLAQFPVRIQTVSTGSLNTVRFDDYIDARKTIVQLSLNGRDTTLKGVKIKIKGVFSGGAVRVESKLGSTQDFSITLTNSKPTYTLSTIELRKIFNEKNVRVQPSLATGTLFSTYILPEADDYQFCFTAFDAVNINLAKSDEDQGCGNSFAVNYLEVPEINLINTGSASLNESGENTNILENQPVSLNVNWLIPAGSNPTTLSYTLKVKEIDGSMNPANLQTAFDATSRMFWEQSNIRSNSTQLPPLSFKKNNFYVFQLTVADVNGFSAFKNKGISSVFWFRNGMDSDESTNRRQLGLQITSVYPEPGDFVPFSHFPVIVKIVPYTGENDLIRDFITSTNIHENSAEGATIINGTILRDIHWASGPKKVLEYFLHQAGLLPDGARVTAERASQIAVNDYKIIPGYISGKSYYWNAEGKIGVTTDIQNRNPKWTDVETSAYFKKGLDKPQLEIPLNNSIVDTGTIQFSWMSAQKPKVVVPPFTIAQINKNDPEQINTFKGIVNEKWVFELSDTLNFTRLLYTISGKAGNGINLQSTEEEVVAELYKEINTSFHLKDSKDYYWRVKWLVNPEGSETGEAYSVSDIFHFSIKKGEPGVGDGNNTQQTSSTDGCNEDCKIDLPADIVAVSTYRENNVISIGKFQLKLTTITYNNNIGRGTGTIMVPYFKAPLFVEFDNIEINSSGQVVRGKVRAVVDAALASEILNKPVSQLSPNTRIKVTQDLKFISALTADRPVNLPIGIDDMVEGNRYTLALTGVEFKPQRATFQAFISIPLDKLGTDQQLTLGADSVCFNPRGINASQSKFYLGDDLSILPGNSLFTSFLLKGKTVDRDGTYLEWNCDGFKQLRIEGEALLNPDTYIKIDENGNETTGPVKASFATTVTASPKDWLLENISIDRFALTDATHINFKVQNATLDLDDVRNTDGMKFPNDYLSDLVSQPAGAWNGFYIKNVSVMLPKGMINHENNKRVEFSIENMLIDNKHGLTFTARATNLLPIDKGSLNDPDNTGSKGFQFGIDTVNLSVRASTFSEFSVKGRIKIPFSSDALKYSLAISNVSASGYGYSMSIRPENTMHIDFANSNAIIEPASSLSIDYSPVRDIKWNYLTRLNCTLDLNPETPAGEINLPGIKIENFIWRNNPDSLDGTMSFASPPKMLNDDYPVTIKDVEFVSSGIDAFALKFNLKLSLGDASLGLEANSYLRILAKTDDSKYFHFAYDKTELDSITVEGDLKVATVKGKLGFYRDNDPTWGNGFKGVLQAKFLKGIEANVIAQFGKVAGVQYWYVDGTVLSQTGFSLFPGVNVKGFGAGAYYNMKLVDSRGLNNDHIKNDGNKPINLRTASLGATQTGLILKPDIHGSWGFRARAFFGPPNSESYKGLVGLTADFNGGGGISQLAFDGAIVIMPGDNTTVKEKSAGSTKPSEDCISGFVNGNYNFDSETFLLQAEMYANLSGGSIRGSGTNDKIGAMEFYADNNTWHLFVGKPTSRVGIKLGNLLNLDAYIMLGQQLPGIPALPPQIQGMSQVQRTDDGSSGIIFGASAGTGGKQDVKMFPPFYATIDMICGFDIGVTKDSLVKNCRKGINGWYFDGQIYAYLQVAAGIYVDVRFYEGKFELAEASCSAALLGGFPNESYLMGTVRLTYSVLGGLVSGSSDASFSYGSSCAAETGDPLQDIKLVGDLTPADNSKNVACGVDPQAIFNLDIKKAFTMAVNQNGRVVNKTFRANINSFKLYKGNSTSGIQIVCQEPIIEQHKIVTLIPEEYLLPFTVYTIAIEAVFEELVNGNWEIHIKRGGSRAIETQKHVFTTGDRPETIEADNVLYTYPLNKQEFFLQGECNNGIIQLQQGQAYLFAVDSDSASLRKTYIELAPLSNPNQKTVIENDKINYSDKSIRFDIPLLRNNEQYTLTIISVGKASNSSIVSPATQDKDNGIVIKNNTFSGIKVKADSIALYSYKFKTSRYNTLREKIAGLSLRKAERKYQGYITTEVLVEYDGAEGFDDYDRNGFTIIQTSAFPDIKPLIKIGSQWNNYWHTDFADTYIYGLAHYLNGVPGNGKRHPEGDFRHAPLQEYNFPPSNAVTFASVPVNLSGTKPAGAKSRENIATVSIAYKVPAIVYQDYMDMNNWIRGIYTPRINTRTGELVEPPAWLTTSINYPDYFNSHNSPYTYMGNPYGNFSYELKFFFIAPANCVVDFDNQSGGVAPSLFFDLKPEMRANNTNRSN